MSSNPLVGLARRWLREQLAADHRADERIADIEHQADVEAQRQLGRALLPGLARRSDEAAARREARAAADEAARRDAMAVVDGASLAVAGDLTGPLPARLRVDAEASDGVLLVQVEPDDLAAPQVVPFLALSLAVPGFTGPGTYDLRAAHDEGWDPIWFALVLDVEDEHFFWHPDAGPCTVVAGPDGALQLHMAFADAASRAVTLTGTVEVPLPAGW